MHSFASLSPDAALLLLTSGILLIYVELNRPGLVLPGAIGLTLTLLSAARFVRVSASPSAVAAFLLALALLALSSRTRTRLPLAFLSTAALGYAFTCPAGAAVGTRPHLATALVCALILGIGTSLLTTIAARARQNKGLDLK